MPAYADTEYEYFEQRGGFIRPTMTAGGGGMLGNQGGGMIGHHQLYPGIRGDVNPHMALGGQLLATETAKLDNRQEEVDDVLFYCNKPSTIISNISGIPKSFINLYFFVGYLC